MQNKFAAFLATGVTVVIAVTLAGVYAAGLTVNSGIQLGLLVCTLYLIVDGHYRYKKFLALRDKIDADLSRIELSLPDRLELEQWRMFSKITGVGMPQYTPEQLQGKLH